MHHVPDFSVPVLDPLQLDVPTEDGVDDVVQDVRVLHLRLHHNLLPLGTLHKGINSLIHYIHGKLAKYRAAVIGRHFS